MKFGKLDERYLAERREVSEKYGPRELWSVIDHWPLYCGIAKLGRSLAICDLLRSTLDVPGHVAEFGSWRGANMMLLAKLLKIDDPHGNKLVHCFDSFEGLEFFAREDGAYAPSTLGSYKGSLEELTDMIRVFDLQDDLVIHEGLIQDTLPPLLEADKGITFSFIYCDTDLFEPTEMILNRMHNRLSKRGLFVFDEWSDSRWPGEGAAANAFMRAHSDDYEMIHIKSARQPTMALRKVRF